jgi:uncharacterized membrane protein YuzA (DUF378 family)
MAEAFFAWAQANEVPFFAVLLAIIGTLIAGVLGFFAGIEFIARVWRTIKSR